MKILIASPGPTITPLFQQLLTELNRDHKIAVVSRYASELSFLAQSKIQHYDPYTLEYLGKAEFQKTLNRFKDTPADQWMLHGVNLWEATRIIRNRYDLLNTGETTQQVLHRAIVNVLSAQTILFEFKPDTMVVWNGHNLESYIYSQLAKPAGTQIRYLERGLLPHSMVIDSRGVNALSRLTTTLDLPPLPPQDQTCVTQYLNAFQAADQSIVQQPKRTSSAQLRATLNIPKDARLIVVPAQIQWDSNILLHCPNLKSNLDVLRALAKEISAYKNHYIIFKTHPENPASENIEQIESDRIRIATSINLHALIDEADLVVTRNSTVGLEAAARGKPTLVLGKAIYSHRGFTYDVNDTYPLKLQLKCALENGFSKAMRTKSEQFIAMILKDYLYFDAADEIFPESNQRVRETNFSSSNLPTSSYEKQGQLAPVFQKAITESTSGIQRATADWRAAAKLKKSPAKNVLVIRFCAIPVFLETLQAISDARIALQITALPRATGLEKRLASIPQVTRTVESKVNAWMEGMQARLGSYDLIIFIHDNAHHVSKRITWIRKSLAPMAVIGLDASWANESPKRTHAS